MYVEDAYLLPAGSPMVRGRSSIQTFWTKAGESVGDMKLTTEDVRPLGTDAAREIGTMA
jgi:ketosteroid isomerase-like protein